MTVFNPQFKLSYSRLILTVVLAGLATQGLRATEVAKPLRQVQHQPNIILLMADDLGWGDTAYNGHPTIKTPHLDQMARDGIRFDRFYSASAVCSPTRASCVTGRNPFRTGVFYANDGILRPEEVTVYEVLQEQGYRTGHFGKWHLGTFTDDEKDANRGGSKHPQLFNLPSEHGVELYFATESKVPTCDPMKKPAGHKSSSDPWDYLQPDDPSTPYGTAYWSNRSGTNQKVTDNLEGDDSRVMMDRAIPFIERAVSEATPFLAVIWFHAPHKPCVAAPEFHQMYQNEPLSERNYYGCITGMDKEIGRLRARLQQLGIADNTMVWFCSDNGPESGPGLSGGFRASKRSLYEGGVRVPGLLVWPNKIKQARVEHAPAVTSDYLPTIMDAVGIPESRIPHQLDGVSLMPLIEGASFKRKQPIGFMCGKRVSYLTERYKVTQKGSASPELYDLLADPYEQENIAAEHPEVTQDLKDQFLLWQAEVKRSFDGAEYGTKSFERMQQSWKDLTQSILRKKSRTIQQNRKTKKQASN